MICGPHVLIVDDDDRLRDLLKRYLTDNGYRVTVASSAPDARRFLSGMEFDIMVLDVMMPGETGINFTKDLRKTNDIPVLLLTAMSETEDRISGFESGADDYLTKPFEPRELLLRITSILKRSDNYNESAKDSPLSLKFGEYIFDNITETLKHGSEIIKLTRSEVDLLKLFTTRPNETISRSELCSHSGVDPTGRALDVQITRLRRKIESNPKDPRYLKTIWGAGYLMRSD